jgi:hypothetical protein
MLTACGLSIPYTIKLRTVIPLVCPTANIWTRPLDVTSLAAHWLEDFPRGSLMYMLQCHKQINTSLNEFQPLTIYVAGRPVNWIWALHTI